MTDTTPAIIKWLQKQDVLSYSQFTIDWLESTLDRHIMMAENGAMPPDNEVNGAIKYEADNILRVLNPGLPDVAFFERVRWQAG